MCRGRLGVPDDVNKSLQIGALYPWFLLGRLEEVRHRRFGVGLLAAAPMVQVRDAGRGASFRGSG